MTYAYLPTHLVTTHEPPRKPYQHTEGRRLESPKPKSQGTGGPCTAGGRTRMFPSVDGEMPTSTPARLPTATGTVAPRRTRYRNMTITLALGGGASEGSAGPPAAGLEAKRNARRRRQRCFGMSLGFNPRRKQRRKSLTLTGFNSSSP